MERTVVTYGQFDRALRDLGFICHLTQGPPPARWYEHQQTGAIIAVPPYPETDRVFAHHLEGARVTLRLYGIADSAVFDANLQKVG